MDQKSKPYYLRNKFLVYVVLTCLLFSGQVLADTSSKKERALQLGVFPHLSADHLEESYSLLAQELSRRLGRQVEFNTQLSLDFFAKDLEAGYYDIAFLQPFDYVKAHARNGYMVVAKQDRKLSAVLTVRPKSHIKSEQDLRGKVLALPPARTAISYLVRDWLTSRGLTPGKDITLQYESSHISCMQKAIFGFTELCGSARPVLEFLSEKLRFDFRVVAETRTIPHTLFAVHPRNSKQLREQVRKAVLNLDKTLDGKEFLSLARFARFLEANDKEYDIVREILTTQTQFQ